MKLFGKNIFKKSIFCTEIMGKVSPCDSHRKQFYLLHYNNHITI
ncbi:hypothetical protein PROSTU_02400 [Providencia stuartii ATCC 25827]|uniref:Uncharacterized protein n=1 Tax=Providencia stuartii ATCC 25827 TaxID=471874 RepID=A0AA86YJ18_PROST|nr:hypothetical protein PROSTU_02400 [Providencia stuartii ATCC 25827]